MVGVLERAFFTGSVGGSVVLARGKSGKGPPSWMIRRSNDTRLWMSFESGFDSDRRGVWNKTAGSAVGAASTGGVGRYVKCDLRK